MANAYQINRLGNLSFHDRRTEAMNWWYTLPCGDKQILVDKYIKRSFQPNLTYEQVTGREIESVYVALVTS